MTALTLKDDGYPNFKTGREPVKLKRYEDFLDFEKKREERSAASGKETVR